MEEATQRQPRQQVDQIGTADLVVGILDGGTEEATHAVEMLRVALKQLMTPVRTVAVGSTVTQNGTGPGSEPAQEDSSFVVLPGPVASEAMSPMQTMSAGYRGILTLGMKLGARACCIVASNLQTVTPQWFYLLTQPVLELDFDLVTPCYGHHLFEGLLNVSIISPLLQALYGQQVQNPLGPDLGFSQRALQKVLENPRTKGIDHPLISLTPAAMGGGLKICQAHVGTRIYPPTDWLNASSLLTQILDPIFADIENNAAVWQRVRGTRPVPAFGEPAQTPAETGSVDIARMIESFQLGLRDLREIWSLILPPASLFELAKLSRLAQEQFRMPDQLWARIVYDFAVGHRLRTISRDHLLRAMTPLYLGWVASYSLEVERTGGAPPDRLPAVFESAKPYFVSRWRWPDRFNP